jgi:hypothetical protein
MTQIRDVETETNTSVICRARAKGPTPLYDHSKFNESIETIIKMLDRLDHFDRIFVEVPKESKEAEKQ